jgi:hypothetical protein
MLLTKHISRLTLFNSSTTVSRENPLASSSYAVQVLLGFKKVDEESDPPLFASNSNTMKSGRGFHETHRCRLDNGVLEGVCVKAEGTSDKGRGRPGIMTNFLRLL